MKKKDQIFFADKSNIKERLDGKGFYLYYYYDGKRLQETGPSKKEVLDKIEKIEKEIRESNKKLENEKVTIREITEELLRKLERKNVTSNTIIDFMKTKKRIESKFYDLDVRKLNVENIEEFLEEEKDLSLSSVSIKKDVQMLKAIIKRAKAKSLVSLAHDPFTFIDLSEFCSSNKKDTTVIKFSDRDKYLEAIKCSRYYELYLLMYRIGLRFSEAIAITEDDISLNSDNNYILKIDKQIIYNEKLKTDRSTTRFPAYLYKNTEDTKKNGQMVHKITNVKTKHGNRKILISNTTANMLFSYIKNNKEAIDNNKKTMNLKPIFLTEKGQALVVNYINSDLKKICLKHNLEVITSHAFRRTAVTRFLESGLNHQEIMAIVGHSTKEMTEAYNKLNSDFLIKNSEKIKSLTWLKKGKEINFSFTFFSFFIIFYLQLMERLMGFDFSSEI